MEKKKVNPVIYKTTNLINGKIYIGQDKYNRRSYYGSGTKIGYAIKKYGKENFCKEILEYCPLEELNMREMFWVKELNAMNPEIGYNLKSGGNQNLIVSEEVKKKISSGNKGKIRTEAFKDKQRQNRHSDDAKKKISEFQKGKPKSEETKRKLSEAQLGKKKHYDVWNKGGHHSEETKQKIRNSVLLNLEKKVV